MMDRSGRRIDEMCWPRGGLKEVTRIGRRWNHDSTVSACNADLNDSWTMVEGKSLLLKRYDMNMGKV